MVSHLLFGWFRLLNLNRELLRLCFDLPLHQRDLLLLLRAQILLSNFLDLIFLFSSVSYNLEQIFVDCSLRPFCVDRLFLNTRRFETMLILGTHHFEWLGQSHVLFLIIFWRFLADYICNISLLKKVVLNALK